METMSLVQLILVADENGVAADLIKKATFAADEEKEAMRQLMIEAIREYQQKENTLYKSKKAHVFKVDPTEDTQVEEVEENVNVSAPSVLVETDQVESDNSFYIVGGLGFVAAMALAAAFKE